jgi:hypothetical protein
MLRLCVEQLSMKTPARHHWAITEHTANPQGYWCWNLDSASLLFVFNALPQAASAAGDISFS